MTACAISLHPDTRCALSNTALFGALANFFSKITQVLPVRTRLCVLSNPVAAGVLAGGVRGPVAWMAGALSAPDDGGLICVSHTGVEPKNYRHTMTVLPPWCIPKG